MLESIDKSQVCCFLARGSGIGVDHTELVWHKFNSSCHAASHSAACRGLSGSSSLAGVVGEDEIVSGENKC